MTLQKYCCLMGFQIRQVLIDKSLTARQYITVNLC